MRLYHLHLHCKHLHCKHRHCKHLQCEHLHWKKMTFNVIGCPPSWPDALYPKRPGAVWGYSESIPRGCFSQSLWREACGQLRESTVMTLATRPLPVLLLETRRLIK